MITQKGIIGVYNDEHQAVTAVRQLKDQGIEVKDVHTPFPVFEIFEAMGLKTRFPYFAFGFGVLGVSLTFLFLYWTTVINYPLVIGGKPHLSLTFIVIMFVMTINITIVCSLIAFFIREKKGPGAVAKSPHAEINDDKFVVVVSLKNDNPALISEIFRNTGAIEVEEKEIA
ncbi:MAG: DUF3341 domain-containing protein [Bacteroidales bacterium]